MDTTAEIEELQNRLWMEKSVSERADFMFGMFALARRVLVDSLPDGLSEKEVRDHVYRRTYGAEPPEGFLRRGDK